MVLRLKWYEWIGWVVEVCMVALGALIISSSIAEKEPRAAVIGALVFGLLVGIWTWVMLFYGKPRNVPGT